MFITTPRTTPADTIIVHRPCPRARPSRPELLAMHRSVADPRDRQGVRHQLPVIPAVGLAAFPTGVRSFGAIGEWVAGQFQP